MAKIDPLQDIASSYNSEAILNSNFDKIEDAMENTLSRDGSTPNAMNADLDMNHNRVLNVGEAVNSADALSLGQFLDLAVAEGSGASFDLIQEAVTESQTQAQSALNARNLAEDYRDEAEDFSLDAADSATASAVSASASNTSAIAADASADIAALAAATAPNVYTDTTAGLAAVADGETFFVNGATGIELYRDVAGVATLLHTFVALSADPTHDDDYYDPDEATSGQRLNVTDGTIAPNAGDFVSDFIAVPAETIFAFQAGASIRHAIYNSSQVFISGALGQRVFYTGASGAYVRIGGPVAQISTLKLEQGLALSDATKDYTDRIEMPTLKLTEAQAKENLFNNDILNPDLLVSEKSLPFNRVSTNLFDTDRVVNGYALLAAGDTVASATGSIAIIPVTGGQLYSFGKKVGDTVSATSPQVYEYSSTGTYVGGATTATYTPAGDGYLLIEFLTADLDNLMMVAGSNLPRLYQPYKRYYLPTHIHSEERKWEGQKFWFLTDSIGVPQNSWTWWVAKEMGLTNYPADTAISAATAATGGSWTNGSTRPAVGGSAFELRNNYGTEAGNDHSISHFYNRVTYLDDSRTGLIIQGGTNGWGTPLGGGMVDADATSIGDLDVQLALYRAAVAGAVDPATVLDLKTTMGSVILLFHRAMNLLPLDPIFMIGAFPRQSMYETTGKIGLTQEDTLNDLGVDLPTYNEHLAAVCRKFGVPFYNPFERTLLRPLVTDNYTTYFKDVTHPNDTTGQELIGHDIVKWLQSYAF